MKKYKLVNDYGSPIYLNFRNLDGRCIKVLPHSFTFVNEDQLLFLTNSSKILQAGILRVEEEAIKNIEEVRESINPKNVFTEERIEKLLDCTIKEIKEELKSVTNTLGLDNLLNEANKKNKPKGYIEAIEDRIIELK